MIYRDLLRRKEMKNGKCQFCGRVHLDSLLDGFGGHNKGYAGSNGKYAFICILHIIAYSIANYSPLGKVQKWFDSFICYIILDIVTMQDAVSLALMGWKIDTTTMRAFRECYSLQGLDKAFKRLDKNTIIHMSFNSTGLNNYRIMGKNNKRTYSKICCEYVTTMHQLNSPYLKEWDIDTSIEYRDATVKNGKNVGITEYMNVATMREYLESIE
jgi:hypothetical protein